MNKWICPIVKHVWNDTMHVLHNFIGFVKNTTAYHLADAAFISYTKELHALANVGKCIKIS